MIEFKFTVPLVPPSVNHYIKHTRSGRHYITKEAKQFKQMVAMCAQGHQVRAKAYNIDIHVYLGSGDRGDADNFLKCILDGLVDGNVIDSDAKITDLAIHKRRDRECPRTEIRIEEAQRKAL